MPRKQVSFIIIPPTDGQVIEFKAARGLLWALCFAGFGLVVALIYFGIGHITHTDQYSLVRQLQDENRDLQRGLELAQQHLGGLEETMDQLAANDDRLRAFHEMEPLTFEERIGGIGGSEELPQEYTALPAQKRALLDELRERIFRLKQETKIQAISFQDIERRYLEREGDLRHLPTISPVSRDKTWISSPFGYRSDPFTGNRSFHAGIDFAGRVGTPVYATADGVVAYAYRDLRLGNVIVIEHDIQERDEKGQVYTRQGLYRTEYGHLDRMLVSAGDRVERGQTIGKLGNTGRSTGPHLHYGVRYQDRRRGQHRGYVDPRSFILDEVPRGSRVASWVPAEE